MFLIDIHDHCPIYVSKYRVHPFLVIPISKIFEIVDLIKFTVNIL